jgi:hypothetical protein
MNGTEVLTASTSHHSHMSTQLCGLSGLNDWAAAQITSSIMRSAHVPLVSKKTMTSENKKEEEETPRPPLLATLARPLHPTQEHKYRLLWPGE